MTSYRSVCTSHAAAALIGGVAVLLAAGPLLGVFGLAADPSSALALRMFGGILFGLGGTLAVARDLTDPVGRSRLVQANLVCDLLLTLVIASAALAGTGGALLWLLAGVFLFNAGSWVMVLARGL